MTYSAYKRAKREYESMTVKKEANGRRLKIFYEERISSSAMTGVTRMIRESELPEIMRRHPDTVVLPE